ncbi:hypothetical protein DOTSEDRAFT_40207 [Dothistroma septosporum NZE10]|uniref:Secreted protein n=1 Tax=Dothistroma septosporum (strain NZE10 / CBS 128990) TaxID=675120 RepID=N1PZU5_DOTSN|nr:hypothetical protein DOTSEDRAFT_40207 [Dothistroma septosporum NZE10]
MIAALLLSHGSIICCTRLSCAIVEPLLAASDRAPVDRITDDDGVQTSNLQAPPHTPSSSMMTRQADDLASTCDQHSSA